MNFEEPAIQGPLARVRSQAWVGTQKPMEEHFRPVEYMPHGWAKPLAGTGFWTSTYRGRYGGDWCQWCMSEQFTDRGLTIQGSAFDEYSRFNARANLWKLIPEADTRIYEIGRYGHLAWLVENYGRVPDPHSQLPASIRREHPDWTAVAQDYDGIHLTQFGQWATRLTMPYSLYGWDCESTLWNRWCFTEVVDLGIVRLKSDGWWEEYGQRSPFLSRYSTGYREWEKERRRERKRERNRYYV